MMSDKYITQTFQEWLNEGTKRFGEDFTKWKFKCPCCGHVASGQDFKDLGADLNDMYQICIGRINGKGMRGFDSKKMNNNDGCDWAAFGLLGNLGKGRTVISPDNKKIDVFDFAEEEVETK